MKTETQRRHDRNVKIKRRRKLLNLLRKRCDREVCDGKLSNGSEVSAVITMGRSRKTNTRKAHDSGYRFKGGFGEANKYSPHDARQMQSLKDDDFASD